MTKKEFFEWIAETCPTHKWDISLNEDAFVVVSFPIEEEEEEE